MLRLKAYWPFSIPRGDSLSLVTVSLSIGKIPFTSLNRGVFRLNRAVMLLFSHIAIAVNKGMKGVKRRLLYGPNVTNEFCHARGRSPPALGAAAPRACLSAFIEGSQISRWPPPILEKCKGS